MAYMQCPECKLTVPATATYLRGDQCPRCLTTMEPRDRFRSRRFRSIGRARAPAPPAPAPPALVRRLRRADALPLHAAMRRYPS